MDYLTSVTRSLLDSKFADGRAIDAAGRNVLVIGGGDTGNDCQGTALRQGCTDLGGTGNDAPAPERAGRE